VVKKSIAINDIEGIFQSRVRPFKVEVPDDLIWETSMQELEITISGFRDAYRAFTVNEEGRMVPDPCTHFKDGPLGEGQRERGKMLEPPLIMAQILRAVKFRAGVITEQHPAKLTSHPRSSDGNSSEIFWTI
jgi:hypothetical protein